MTPFETFLDRCESAQFQSLVVCPCGWFACGSARTTKRLHEQHRCGCSALYGTSGDNDG